MKVGIPNYEVKRSFSDVIIKQLTRGYLRNSKAFISRFDRTLEQAFADRDFAALKDVFNKIFNVFSYGSIQHFNESSFRDVIVLALILLKYHCVSEEHNALGRCDLSIETKDKVYVFELKLVSRREQADEALSKAREQIKSRRYAVKLTDKEVVSAVMVVND